MKPTISAVVKGLNVAPPKIWIANMAKSVVVVVFIVLDSVCQRLVSAILENFSFLILFLRLRPTGLLTNLKFNLNSKAYVQIQSRYFFDQATCL